MSHRFQQTTPAHILGKRYKLISQLGTGGFGQTFLAQDLHLPGRPRCVVKRLFAQSNDAKRLQTARRLFNTEAQVLYHLGNHSQIPSLLAHFEENQEFYLVQEFIEGESLSQQLGKGKRWSEEQVVELLKDTLQILAFVHQQQVIHRDIKPSNLMHRRKDSRIVLIDFGAVKQVTVQSAESNRESTDLTVSIGTHGYIPSEQLAGKPRYSSDVYAVGMTGIQALTGIHPKQLGENPQTGELEWRIHALTASPELVDVLENMVRYDFRDRYPSAIEALEALRQLPANLSSSPHDLSDDTIILPVAQPVAQVPSLSAESTITEKNGDHPPRIDSSDAREETLTLVDDAETTSRYPSKTNQQPKSLAPTRVASTLLHQPSAKWWAVLAGSAIVGTAFLSFKFAPPPKPITQTIAPSNSSVKPTTATTPAQRPTPVSPAQQAANLLEQADRWRKQGQYQQALGAYNKVIALKPKMAQAYWGRCASFNGLKQPDNAIVACNDALAIKPNYAEALWGKGKAVKQQDRLLEALGLFEQATNLKPSLADAWVDRGATLQEVGRSVEAIAALDNAIALNRNSAEAWSIRGSALWNLGRFDQAVVSLDKALQIQPNARNARALRQQARQELGY